MNKEVFNLEDYLNIELIHPQALAGKQIRGVFTPTNNSFVFIITETNEMAVYQVEQRTYTSQFSCTCEGACSEEEGVAGIYEVLTNKDLLEILLYNQDDFFFEKYNVFKDKEGLEKEVGRREEIEQRNFEEKERQKRFELYQQLQKEFAGQKEDSEK